MLFSYYKGTPSTYVLQYRDGKVVREGGGLSFFYTPYNTTVAAVPLTTQDLPFAFTETSADFQDVAVQGQLTYRVVDPKRLAERLDYSVHPSTGLPRTDDPEKLEGRIQSAVRAQARAWVHGRTLEAVLAETERLERTLEAVMQAEALLAHLGVVVEALYVAAVTVTPETKRALEAEYREALLRRADEAVYARRAASVEEERQIQQRELGTEVQLEEDRRRLVALQAENQLTQAEADARAEELRLAPSAALSARTLTALALRDWAQHGGTIDALTVTPDLLAHLTQALSRPSA
ncbi:MAG: SPFH domain-containing protein [Bacteroidota bacterium]